MAIMTFKALSYWSFTVSCNYTSLPDPERMRSILSEFGKQWCFQLEQGHNANKQHYQCRIILPQPQKTETLLTVFEQRIYDRRDITFLPESNNSIAQGGLSFYVMKDDTRVDGPWHDPTYTPKKVVDYNFEDLSCMSTPLPFQQAIMELVQQPPDDRTINWLYNPAGCAGKSKLMKYLRSRGEFDFARIPLGSATQIKTSCVDKGPHKIYFVDLPKVRGGDERQQELFSAIEEIKNGWVESAMYGKVQELLMMPPHVWCLSNELPNLSYASRDRWVIWTISTLTGNLIPYLP